jgi:hypothetical protein
LDHHNVNAFVPKPHNLCPQTDSLLYTIGLIAAGHFTCCRDTSHSIIGDTALTLYTLLKKREKLANTPFR